MIATSQFWHTSRGQLIRILRFAEHTVTELAGRVRLTENAVRAHLVSLERDGLVRLSGRRPGVRRPNYTYQLTAKAEQLFPNAYAPVLTHTMAALQKTLTPEQQRTLIAQTAQSLASPYLAEMDSLPFPRRLDRAIAIINGLGGTLRSSAINGSVTLRGSGCPLSAVVHDSGGTAACQIMQETLSLLLRVPVSESCDRGERPQCCFKVATPAQS